MFQDAAWKRATRSAICRFGIASALAVAVIPAASAAFAGPVDGDERAAAIDALVAGAVPGSPAMSGIELVVIDKGEVVFDHAAGIATLDERGKTSPLTTDHKVRIASISKLVATIGLMQLVEAGKVDLDHDVADYAGFPLRNPNFPDQPITLRQILSHTSSIRDDQQYWLPLGRSLKEFFLPGSDLYVDGGHYAAGEGQAPGQYYTYSNLNFGVVAGVIERVSGQRFDLYMKQHVLQPLGLDASYNVCDVSAATPERLGSLFRKSEDGGDSFQPEGPWRVQIDGDKVACHYGMTAIPRGERAVLSLADYVPGDNPTLFSPQGGLRASAHDLAKIARMFLGDGMVDGVRILKPETVAQMWTPVWTWDPALQNGNTTGEDNPKPGEVGSLLSYGLSVDLMRPAVWGLAPQSLQLGGHRGDAYGLLGLFYMDREHKRALVALMTGFADDPNAHKGQSSLARPEEEVLKWWIANFGGSQKP